MGEASIAVTMAVELAVQRVIEGRRPHMRVIQRLISLPTEPNSGKLVSTAETRPDMTPFRSGGFLSYPDSRVVLRGLSPGHPNAATLRLCYPSRNPGKQ